MSETFKEKIKKEKATTKFKRIIVVGFGNITKSIVRVHTEDDVFLVFENTQGTRDAWRKLGISMEEERKLLIEYYLRDYGGHVAKGHNVIINMKLLPNKQPDIDEAKINEAKVKLAKHGASW